MADILIKGLSLPKNYPYRLTIESDGTVSEHTIGAKATAIKLPQHGDLIDLRELKNRISRERPCLNCKEYKKRKGDACASCHYYRVLELIDFSEVVVEANNG